MNLSDSYIIRKDDEITDYVFIDPTRLTHYPKVGRDAYETAVSFSVSSKIDKNYPVVFTDLTTSSGEHLEKIAYADVPAPIKRRLVAWLKLQPPPAKGPAGAPANPLGGRPSGSSGKNTGSDRIKDELVRSCPGTHPNDWKRRTRIKKEDGIHRRFEHADGRIIDTIETEDGTITIVS